MKFVTLAVVVCGVTLLAGCANTVAPRSTPFTDLNSTIRPKQYKELTVALVFTDNTKSTMKQVEQWADHVGRGRDGFRHAGASALAENILAPFSKSFKSVERVASLEDAKASNADLIAMLDLSTVLPANAFSECKINMSVTVLASDGKHIDIVTGQAGNGDYLRVDEKVGRVSTDASQHVESALYGSEKLIEFAKAKAGTGTVVTTRPPVTIPPSEEDRLSLSDPRG